MYADVENHQSVVRLVNNYWSSAPESLRSTDLEDPYFLQYRAVSIVGTAI